MSRRILVFVSSFALLLSLSGCGGGGSDPSSRTPTPTRSKWTVLVYLNAANNLYPFAATNVDQMERVASDDVRFVVQWKETKKEFPNAEFDGTRRVAVRPGTASGVDSPIVETLPAGTDMGQASTLREFVQWGKAKYPADRYAVVVWSHGNGWHADARMEPVRATSYDDEFLSAIDVWDLGAAFAGEHFDIVSFDACLMQMLEVATEVAPHADFIAASSENTPGPGYPYDRVFSAFKANPDLSTRALTESFVTGHAGNPSYQNTYVTQSILETARLADVRTAVDGLAGAMIAEKDALTTVVPEIRDAMQKYGFPNDGYRYYDLGDIAARLQAHASVPAAVKTAAAAVATARAAAVAFEGHTSRDAFSTGLAIDFSPSTASALRNYGNLTLAKTTRWDEWLAIAP